MFCDHYVVGFLYAQVRPVRCRLHPWLLLVAKRQRDGRDEKKISSIDNETETKAFPDALLASTHERTQSVEVKTINK